MNATSMTSSDLSSGCFLISASKFGQLNHSGDNAVLIFPGLSYGSNVTSNGQLDALKGWWEEQVGPGKVIDTNVYCVYSFGLSSYHEPSTNDHVGNILTQKVIGAPSLSSVALAATDLLKKERVNRIQCVLGTSIGSLTAALFATYSGAIDIKHLVFFCGGISHTNSTRLLRDIQKKMLTLGKTFDTDAEKSTLILSRQISLLLYSSPHSLQRRAQSSSSTGILDWSYANAEKYASGVTPSFFHQLIEATDRAPEDIRPSQIYANHPKAKATCVYCTSDILYGAEASQRTWELLTESGIKCRQISLDSRDGHDSFLTDSQAVTSVLQTLFTKGADRR
jgi:homoserine acetyltransferase